MRDLLASEIRRPVAARAALAGALAVLALAGVPAVAQPPSGRPATPPPRPAERPPVAQPGVPAWAQPSSPPPSPSPPEQQSPTAATTPVIARVGGREIRQLDYDRVAEPYFRAVRAQLGADLTEEMEKIAKFNVLDELIRREILAIEGQRQQIVVTEAETDALLQQDPFFLTDGRFDPVKFRGFKTSPGSNYALVLPILREAAAARKLDESLRRRFAPSRRELRAEWTRRSDRVRFSLFPLLQRDITLEPEATEAEWEEYFRAHPDLFMRRARVRLRYARLPLPAEGDTTRAQQEAEGLAHGRDLADSLRAGTVPDTSARLLDTGLFDIPTPAIPGLGRVAGLADTLGRAEADSTLRVVGPYVARDAVIVGVVVERKPRELPPMREVLGDVKRRADLEKRRTAAEEDRRAFYETHRDRWRRTRATVMRVTLDPARFAVKPARPRDVEAWYERHGPSLFGLPDTSKAWMPPLDDSLRTAVAARLADEERARRAGTVMDRIARDLNRGRDPRKVAGARGALAETLAFYSGGAPDTLFSALHVDSLLATAATSVGTLQGPRGFARRWAVWRVDRADTSFVPPYEVVRTRSDQEFADERRRQDEEEALEHFGRHREDYRTPVKYALDYVAIRIPPPDSVAIPEADIRPHYERNTESFRQEEQVRARHILFMTRGATPEEDRAAKARADSLHAAIVSGGGDFAELARRFSQEPGASTSGGDLGWFGRGRMVPEFEQAAFALAPGGTSPVVKTTFGYHIIRLEERRAAGIRPFEETRDEIRRQLGQARGDSLALRAARTLRRELARGGEASGLAAPHGGVVAVSPLAANESLPGIGVPSGLPQDLPGMPVGRWAPSVYRAGERYLVMRVRERVPERPAEFDEVKGRAVEDMKLAKRRALLEQRAEAIRAALAAGASIDSLAAPYGGLRDTGPLGTGTVFVPMLGSEPRVVERAFAMKPGEVSDTLQVAQGIAWVRLEEKLTADPAAFEVAAAQIEAEIIKQRYDEWLEGRRKAVRIEILRPDLRGPRPSLAPAATISTRR